MVTEPTVVIACHMRHPPTVYGRQIYRIVVDAGDFVSSRPPLIFDLSGAPTTLHSELMPGSVVRVEHDCRSLRAVQLITPRWQNPFARWIPALMIAAAV